MHRIVLPVALTALLAFGAIPAGASLPIDTATGLALPVRARVDAAVQELGYYVGRVEIPSIGVDEVIREGVSLDVIDRGVARWSGTARPGGIGNLVLAGHRTLYGAPFHDLDLLQVGDEILVTAIDGASSIYKVTESMIVTPEDMWIVEQTSEPTLTLFACHPKGSARQRIVVRADLVSVPLLAFP
ncbi:MAG TPA: class E sortase [Acidimicrobiia bacterium]